MSLTKSSKLLHYVNYRKPATRCLSSQDPCTTPSSHLSIHRDACHSGGQQTDCGQVRVIGLHASDIDDIDDPSMGV